MSKKGQEKKDSSNTVPSFPSSNDGNPRRFFLGLAGKTHGPYSKSDIEAMEVKGDLSQYFWIWDSHFSEWQPLDSMPPPPEFPISFQVEENPKVESPQAIPKTVESKILTFRKYPFKKLMKGSKFEVICHDSKVISSGRLKEITEGGCFFVTQSESNPGFGIPSRAALSIYDPNSKQLSNIGVSLLGVARVNGRWTFRVGWTQCPEIIQAAAIE